VSTPLQELLASSHFNGGNAAYLEGLYEQWLEEPDAVPEAFRALFDQMPGANGVERGHLRIQEHFRNVQPGRAPLATTAAAGFDDYKQAGVLRLINAYRVRGHENAKINPLGVPHHEPVPDLDIGFHGLDQGDLDTEFNTGWLAAPDRMKLRDIVALCQRVYTGSIGAEFMHIVDTPKRHWLEERLEGCGGIYQVDAPEKLRILDMLTAAEGLEKFLHTRYVGQKRFSLEGGESLIPLLYETVQHAGTGKVEEVVIGMAHRGRLNVLVNILGKSPSMLFDEFEGKHNYDPRRSGDVKYHLGYASDMDTAGGNVHMAMAFNPSHLEIVDPVVAGSAKARQIRRGDQNHDQVMPILIHGDAAFAAQGVVYELFQMSETRGFGVGGTLHVVINNQVGFTTSNPDDSRSTLYCTAIAKAVHAPVFHVNGDDPEAVHHVMKIACDFRMRFKRDVVIDLVCYRRHGHNEADEPAATQPVMYKIIRGMKTTRAKYAEQLEKEGVIEAGHARKLMDDYRGKLDQGEQVTVVDDKPRRNEHADNWHDYDGDEPFPETDTAFDGERARELAQQLTQLPDGFKLHARVQRIIDDRRKMSAGELPMDWGYAETLAYATLIDQGHSLRLVGQDSGRGTFFHRHAVLHNQEDGSTFTPLTTVDPDQYVTVIDSLLSEEAVMAFEYGYATAAPETLVIWEAQFGDFANGAQVVIDQFLAAGETKWGRLCGLALFLPHGYAGQGPEHSSARLERFMQLCSFGNLQVCVPSTPAQIFHMLRRQMLQPTRKPLVVMMPKSLLRNKASTSDFALISEGRFQLVIDDRKVAKAKKKAVKRVVLCSGKVFYDLDASRDEQSIEDMALIRVEQLHPFPDDELVDVLSRYPNLEEVAWCQEEPKNQGAWYQIRHHLQDAVGDLGLFYVGRRRSPSPATGYFSVHVAEQEKLVADALTHGEGQVN
jgi:2-oxoglutarate dehydrogenase E1 component